MKNNLHKIVLIFILLTLSVPALTACRSKTNSSTQTTSTQTANQPIEVISVLGPLPPINPGGPIVEITLKNISAVPVVSLSAVFTNLGMSDFAFAFDVGTTNPLLPGASISDKLTLIGAGFSNNVSYPLTIKGTLQNGVTFSYVEQVEIVGPAD